MFQGIRRLPAASQPVGLSVAPAFASDPACGGFSLRSPLQSLAHIVHILVNDIRIIFCRFLFTVAVVWSFEHPRLSWVDRIRHSSRRPPVCSFRGRLRSLPATSCGRISKIAAPLLAIFEIVRFGSNPVDPSLISGS